MPQTSNIEDFHGFLNRVEKEKTKHPDYRGTIKISNGLYDISGWYVPTPNGTGKRINLQLRPQESEGENVGVGKLNSVEGGKMDYAGSISINNEEFFVSGWRHFRGNEVYLVLRAKPFHHKAPAF